MLGKWKGSIFQPEVVIDAVCRQLQQITCKHMGNKTDRLPYVSEPCHAKNDSKLRTLTEEEAGLMQSPKSRSVLSPDKANRTSFRRIGQLSCRGAYVESWK
jgi:hypothetical protein